jgi:3-oxoacyl-[acyl-carrier-protein] synthase-1
MKTHKHAVPELCITGLGLVTAVGHDYKTACASIRSGLKRSTKLHNFYVPNKNSYDDVDDGLVSGHPVLEGDPDQRETRIVDLLAMALSDLAADAGLDQTLLAGTRFYLALPDNDRAISDDDAFKEAHLKIDTWPFSERTPIRLFPSGHAGMLVALSDAAEAMQRGDIERAVIAGADSLINFNDLSRLNAHERLKTGLNPDGLIPGEAASAFLVEKTEAAQKRKAVIQCVIRAISTAHEPQPLAPGKPALGTGLAHAITGLLNPEDTSPLSLAAIVSDLNGEPCRFAEWSMAQTKVMHATTGSKELICPARMVGDTGAASAGLSLCLAARAMQRGYLSPNPNNKNDNALILASSDTGERAAVLLGS